MPISIDRIIIPKYIQNIALKPFIKSLNLTYLPAILFEITTIIAITMDILSYNRV